MWHEILYRVLSIINYVVLIIMGLPILEQLLYVLFGWLKKKTYPKSEVKAKIAYIIPAHNEEVVIYDTVKSIFDKQNYPKELIDVYVVADNCTDNTEKLAKEAGAKVIVRHDDDPTHRMALYPLKEGIDYIIHLEDAPEIVIHLDADNHINDDFSSLMNDAYQTGVDFARPYEGATNGAQNFYTKGTTLFYCFDSRYASRTRERFGIAAHINGAGAMMSTRMLLKCGGYDAATVSDDAEFNFNRMLDGYKGHYVEEAIVYEDMPSSFSDTVTRTKRIGSGSMKLLKTKIKTMFFEFFKTGNLSYLEMVLMVSLTFLSVLFCIWLPLFFVYDFTYLALIMTGHIEVTMRSIEYYTTMFWNTIWCIVGIGGGLFFIFGFVQSFFMVITDYKKVGAKRRRDMMSAIIFFPFFVLLYAAAISVGAMSKNLKWKAVKRNVPNE